MPTPFPTYCGEGKGAPDGGSQGLRAAPVLDGGSGGQAAGPVKGEVLTVMCSASLSLLGDTGHPSLGREARKSPRGGGAVLDPARCGVEKSASALVSKLFPPPG
mmetsp:Transcript_135383/g.260089  ORF Transcript_135383/g.260089 Transcript_135383/m.260089 type:complete len:104 (-) Transcript_135383:1978-2289(-)